MITGRHLRVAKAMYETKYFQRNFRWEDATNTEQMHWISLADVAIRLLDADMT